MNWYFEEQGVSRGPFTEERLIAKFKAGEFASDDLIWQPEMTEWREAGKVKTEWLSEIQSPAPSIESSPTDLTENKPASVEPKHVAPPTSEDTLPVASVEKAALEGASSPQSQKAALTQSKLKPKAPVEGVVADAPKSGLLKRVFGLGGKKN